MFKQAKEKFSQVKSVEEWNQVFDQYKNLISVKDMAEITASGLIVQVLGPDQK